MAALWNGYTAWEDAYINGGEPNLGEAKAAATADSDGAEYAFAACRANAWLVVEWEAPGGRRSVVVWRNAVTPRVP